LVKLWFFVDLRTELSPEGKSRRKKGESGLTGNEGETPRSR
jgi:hypothetical protein